MKKQAQDYIALLRQFGLKASHQRVSILRVLNEMKTHPSAEEIYKALSSEIPTVARTTVDNTLNGFIKAGIVVPLSVAGSARYDLFIEDHEHFICINCGKIEDVRKTDSKCDDRKIKNGRVLNTHITYRGYCTECIKKGNVDK